MGPYHARSVWLVIAVTALPLMTVGLSGCATGAPFLFPPLETVDSVDVERYLGKWFEIARYPVSFEEGCVGVTAEYALRDDGRIRVLNTCIEGTLDGPVRTIEGTGRVIEEETNAKLAVSFFGPFEGPYWILMLDEDYQWAVVGEPSRSTLWILSRTPQLDEDTLDMISAALPDLGYDPERLIMTPQAPE